MIAFAPLEEIARVSLGYKSLQNDFFYINKATIDSHGIEERFVSPIFLFKDLNAESYLQTPQGSVFLFLCRENLPDLRGTGALRYIRAMERRAANEKKQSSGSKTIREVLEAQGGEQWFAPKAKPHGARIWLRKAFNTTYSPFLFRQPAVVDQRCNYLEPTGSVDVDVLAAIVTSATFAYAIEVNGSVSMGAGALEAATTKLRHYPILDARALNEKECANLVRLARAVWNDERPINWGDATSAPGKNLRELDEYVLTLAGNKIPLTRLYDDLRAACIARIRVAEDKTKTTKKLKTVNIGNVAGGIAASIAPILEAKQFPENFHTSRKTMQVAVPPSGKMRIAIMPWLNDAEIIVYGADGHVLWRGTHEAAVTETIARALLLGRNTFEVPGDRTEAAEAIRQFLEWFRGLQARIEKGIQDSALGTGYERVLREHVYRKLGMSEHVADQRLPSEIAL